MYITYQDDLGYVKAKLNDSGVQFIEGKAYFILEDGHDLSLPIKYIVEITED